VWLTCSRRCGGELFRALFAEVEVDSSGEYQSHRLTQPGFICLNCGAPAIDLGDVSAEMAAEREEELAPTRSDVLCPHCETAVSVLPGEPCPNCGHELDGQPL
jgi:DNA-directed RNA polymerase subunit RPC12/RpoP